MPTSAYAGRFRRWICENTNADVGVVNNSVEPPPVMKISEQINTAAEEEAASKSLSSENRCEDCGEVLVREEAEVYCDECGNIVDDSRIDQRPNLGAISSNDERKQARAGGGLPVSSSSRDLASLMNGSPEKFASEIETRLDGRRRQRLNNQRTYEERTFEHGRDEIERISSGMGLPRYVRETAVVLFKRAREKDLLQGRSIEGVAAAALLLATRVGGCPRRPGEFGPFTKENVNTCQNLARMLQRELGIGSEPVEPEDYIPQIVSKLNTEGGVEPAVRELLRALDRDRLYDGRDPAGIAASAIYAVIDSRGVGITQKEVAEAADVCTATIRKQYRELRQEANSQ